LSIRAVAVRHQDRSGAVFGEDLRRGQSERRGGIASSLQIAAFSFSLISSGVSFNPGARQVIST